MSEEKKEKKDFLKLELTSPVEWQGQEIRELDMTKLREMTGEELNVVYDLYEAQGGDGIIMQEGKLRFAQVIASRVTGYPLEAIQKIKAKDSVALKNRVYRFFFLTA
ncbi:phage tail assembly protein [Enterocloster sp.]|uniref:phage tail assembly protein n=1 Tax=Enterocloster sp. TaxID=2719315 RepID=UPI00399F3F3B